ncbi:MAG: PD40 domain-containing protein [Chloroflexi bacterium]|nr:PD40 domain-containing protein [Chloroflexota bacterium]
MNLFRKIKRYGLILWIILLFILACNIPFAASSPTPDLFATLSAATPLSVDSTARAVVSAVPEGEPFGQIAFTCQIFKITASNQICIINANGTGLRRLTTDDTKQHYYPSLAPDGKSVVYAAFREPNIYEIYEVEIASGVITQLTDRLGNLNGPEISPDGSTIVFKLSSANSNQLWLMDRDGSNPRQIPNASGWDPTWSPDGNFILFASDMEGAIQLFSIRTDGSELKRISDLPAIRGRNDWSPDGQFIVTYSGQPWNRDVYIMNADGSNAHILSPTGGNSQGPSFSPDGQWVAFTSYFDHYGDDHGCEIYIMRVDGTDLRRLTDNDYCDFQPRWGP